MSDLLPPGNMPAPAAGDDPREFPDFFASDMWPSLWPKMVFTYASAAARDADLAGLGPADVAFAYLLDKAWLTRWTGTAWKPTHPVWGSQSVTFVAGLATITHNLGFTPSLFKPFPRVGSSPISVEWNTGTTNSTTAVIRGWDGGGVALATSVTTIGWVAYP